MEVDARILITGQCPWVGNAVVRRLWAAGFHNVRLLRPDEVNLTRQAEADVLFGTERPAMVFLTAPRSGAGIAHEASAVRDSLAIQANVIHAAWRAGVRKLCYLASSGIYPARTLRPTSSSALLSAAIEPSHDVAAVAQIAGIRLCQVYRQQYGFDAVSLVPPELYGPGNSPGAQAGVIPALLRRLLKARLASAPTLVVDAVPAWEWLQVDDYADAALHLMRIYAGDRPINADTGELVAFHELATMLADALGYRGRLIHVAPGERKPPLVPEGAGLGAMGWSPHMPLRHGIEQLCAWHRDALRPSPA